MSLATVASEGADGERRITAKAEHAARRWAARAAAKKQNSRKQYEESLADAAMRAAAKAQRQANQMHLHEASQSGVTLELRQKEDSDDDSDDGWKAVGSASPPRLVMAASAEPLKRWANRELAARHAAGECFQLQRDAFRSASEPLNSDTGQ